MNVLTYLLNKLKEKSTWAGLATLTALMGLKLEPEQFGAISAAAIALIGVYEVFRKES
jgi:hypothetical protein